jgi:hypothetical protein
VVTPLRTVRRALRNAFSAGCRFALPDLSVEVGAPVEGEMRMAVDESRYDEAATGLDRL